MPDIEVLTSQIQQLESSSSLWGNISLWLIASTAIVAVGYFVTSWVASKKADALQSTQKLLFRAKDEQLIRDLKDKEDQIATLRIELAKAQTETAKAVTAQEELRGQNLATESRLEEERRTRLELEKTLAPRQISLEIDHGKTNIDPLRRFAGIHMIVEYLPEAEPIRAAENIVWLTQEAG